MKSLWIWAIPATLIVLMAWGATGAIKGATDGLKKKLPVAEAIK